MATTTRLNNGTTNESINGNNNNDTQKDIISNNRPQRPYHSWQGNNTILCDGRIIGGPQKNNYLYTLGLIIVPSGLFCGGVCRNFIIEYNLYYVLIIYIILLIISLISFTLTAFSDPGIIPRGILPKNLNYKGPVHLKQRMCISGKLVEIKWCGTCHIFRPPRSFHCYICNNCVERFDHHCPWIGNCIGIRNYAYFTIFVNSLQLVCFWALSHCIYIMYLRAMTKENGSDGQRFIYMIKHEYMAFITSIYVFIGMWFVIGLTWFHWFLVFVGKTTNEQLRNLHPAGSPFKRSFIGNVIDMCCKLPKSSVHLHHISPTASYNELYINKQKVILLDNDQVQKHHKEIHHRHISNNSPFKNCLINNFGYNDSNIYNSPNSHSHKNKHNGHGHNHLNGLEKSLEYSEMIDSPHSNKNGHYDKYKNGINARNGYSRPAAIQMTQKNTNDHHDDHRHDNVNGINGTNGYHHNGDINEDNDGKIEEEEEKITTNNVNIKITTDSNNDNTNIATTSNANNLNSITTNSLSPNIQIQLENQPKTVRNSIVTQQIEQDEEEEENKYDDINPNGNNNRPNRYETSKSKSRRDENEDQDRLYTSYDDEDEDDDDDDDDNNLTQPHSFQYSRSVTPDVSVFNNNNTDNDNDNDNIPQTPPESNTNNNSSILGIKVNNNRTISNASSKTSVPSESPASDYAMKNLTDFQ